MVTLRQKHRVDCPCPQCKRKRGQRFSLNKRPSSSEFEGQFLGSSGNRFSGSAGEVDRKSREYIRWVQASLNKMLGLQLAVDGISGSKTRSAIRSFQEQYGLAVDGIVGENTEKALIKAGAGQPPRISKPRSQPAATSGIHTSLPASGSGYYSYTTASERYGIPETIQAIQSIGRGWQQAHPNGPRLGIGDMSLQAGGPMSGHKSHQKGVDVDIRLVRNDGTEGRVGYQDAAYSRTLTQELVDRIINNGILRVQHIFFNDPAVKGVRQWPGHDNHLHIRFYPTSTSGERMNFEHAPEWELETEYGAESTQRNVRWYQTILKKAAGYPNVPINGNHNDSITKEAMRSFQRKYGLKETGYLEVDSNLALRQIALQKIYKIDIPNKVGMRSQVLEDYLKKFQRDYNLDPDGKIGLVTMKKMLEVLQKKQQLKKPKKPKPVKPSKPKPDQPKPSSATDVSPAFVRVVSPVVFRNSTDINDFFQRETGKGFVDWFNSNMSGSGRWVREKGQPLRIGNHENRATIKTLFNQIWDQIPGMFGTPSINLFQFLSLMSIFINEIGSALLPISERVGRPDHPGIAYAFNKIGKKMSYNRSPNRKACELFNDPEFLKAHGHLPEADRVRNTTDKRWCGERYPADFPTDPKLQTIIHEADFFKFRGRGLIQTTWRSAYTRLIKHIQDKPSIRHPVVDKFRRRWAGLSSDTVATTSTNDDWDELFMKTDLLIPVLGVHLHIRKVAALPLDAVVLSGKGVGSIWKLGRSISASSSYLEKYRTRVLQMLNALGNGMPYGEPDEFEAYEDKWSEKIRKGKVDWDRGNHIRWIQQSLNQIMSLRLPVDGIMGPATRSAIRSFQKRRGLTADGNVGSRIEAALIETGAIRLKPTTHSGSLYRQVRTANSEAGYSNDEVSMIILSDSVGNGGTNKSYDVQAVQNLLNKFIVGGKLPGIGRLAVDGQIGSRTISAIRAFQKSIVGMANSDGRVDPGGRTLQSLNGPIDQRPTSPSSPSSTIACKGSLPDVVGASLAKSGLGYCSRTSRRFGLAETIQALNHIAIEWWHRHPNGPVIIVSDISQCGGGKIAGTHHSSHRIGLDADLSFRKNHRSDQCESGQRVATGGGAYPKTKDYESVWRPLYEELIEIIDDNPYLSVKRIWFQDKELERRFRRGDGTKLVSTSEPGHDRHMHVRFCIPDRYRASKVLDTVSGVGVKSYICN